MVRGMEAINEVHVSEPGLVVVDVAAADDETAFAFHTALAARTTSLSLPTPLGSIRIRSG